MLIVADLTFLGDNIRVYSKWIQCGERPVEIVSTPGAGREWYQEVRTFELMRFGNSTYFCSAHEAETAGYRPH